MTNETIYRNISNKLFIVRAFKKNLIQDINLLFQIRVHFLHSYLHNSILMIHSFHF